MGSFAFPAGSIIMTVPLTKEDHAMSLQERIEALKAKHNALERAIEEENNRPHPDDMEIVRLKKQKLQIKDEIANLARQD
jgi:hypothetical protein